MKRRLLMLILVVLFSLFTVSPAFASNGEALGGCPGKFELHPFMEHEDHDHPQHIGLDKDINGDGWICVKHISPELHVHMDNVLPLE